LKIFSLLNAKR